MKKIAWIIGAACLAVGIPYASNYALSLSPDNQFIPSIAIPLFFIGLYVAGSLAYYLTGSRAEGSAVSRLGLKNAAITFVAEVLIVAAASLTVGKVFGSWSVCSWFAAILVLIIPSPTRAYDLMHQASMVNDEE